MNESDLLVGRSDAGTIHVVASDGGTECGAEVDEALEPLDIDGGSASLCGNCANQLENRGYDPDRLRRELR